MAEADQPVAALLRDLSEQTSTLVRKELELARLEMTEKGKRAGIGVGMFGGAGLVGLYALGAVIAAAILALATAITPWLAALSSPRCAGRLPEGWRSIGKSKVSQATPPVPEQATESVKEDVRWTKSQGRGGAAMSSEAEGSAATNGDAEKRTPEQVQAEIEETRAELGDTVEALVAKTDVKGQAKQAVNDAKATVADKAAEVKQTVTDKKDEVKQTVPARPTRSSRPSPARRTRSPPRRPTPSRP